MQKEQLTPQEMRQKADKMFKKGSKLVMKDNRYCQVGDFIEKEERYGKARTYLEQALNLYKQEADSLSDNKDIYRNKSNQIDCLMYIGRSYNNLDTYGTAEDYVRQAISLYEQNVDRTGLAKAYYFLGQITYHKNLGEKGDKLSNGLKYFKKALSLFHYETEPEDYLETLAEVASKYGDKAQHNKDDQPWSEKAQNCWRELYDKTKDRNDEFWDLYVLAVDRLAGKPGFPYEKTFQDLAELSLQKEMYSDYADCLCHIADHCQESDPQKFEQLVFKASEYYAKDGDYKTAASSIWFRFKVSYFDGSIFRKLELEDKIMEYASKATNAYSFASRAADECVKIYEKFGYYDKIIPLLEKYIYWEENLTDEFLVIGPDTGYQRLAKLYTKFGQYDKAKLTYEKYVKYLETQNDGNSVIDGGDTAVYDPSRDDDEDDDNDFYNSSFAYIAQEYGDLLCDHFNDIAHAIPLWRTSIRMLRVDNLEGEIIDLALECAKRCLDHGMDRAAKSFVDIIQDACVKNTFCENAHYNFTFNLGKLEYHQGHFDKCIQHYLDTMPLTLESSVHKQYMADVYNNLSETLLSVPENWHKEVTFDGKTQQLWQFAEHYLKESIRLFDKHCDECFYEPAILLIIRMYMALNMNDQAIAMMDDGIRTFTCEENYIDMYLENELYIYFLKGRLFNENLHDGNKARLYFAKVRDVYRHLMEDMPDYSKERLEKDNKKYSVYQILGMLCMCDYHFYVGEDDKAVDIALDTELWDDYVHNIPGLREKLEPAIMARRRQAFEAHQQPPMKDNWLDRIR